MVQPYEGELEDLFDFPEVPGLEEFGLVPPVPAGANLSEYETPARPTVAEEQASPEPAAVEAEPTAAAAPQPETSAHPNPPLPEGITDLDEDLFNFDELFIPEDDPFGLEQGAMGAGFAGDVTAAAVPEPLADVYEPQQPEALEPAQVQPQPAPQAVPEPEPAPGPVSAPAPQIQEPAAAQPAPAPSAAPTLSELPMELAAEQGADAPRLARDRGPRILLPEDVPYAVNGDRNKLVWALVACFLLVNTCIFLLAHQASSNVNATISEATGLIAEALGQRANQAPDTLGAAPATLSEGVTHTVTEPTSQEAPARSEPWIDPRDFKNTHAFYVESAKKMMGDGRFEEARRLLNYVLANQARVPLENKLRQEITYLIPMTYDQQARTVAPEEQP